MPPVPPASLSDPSPLWRIWVDTGGTFTDCIAIPPETEASPQRIKVLSSGSIRLRVLSIDAASCAFRFHAEPWHSDSLLKGMDIHIAGSSSRPTTRVDACRCDRGLLTPARHAAFLSECSAIVAAGQPLILELNANEEAPILAARAVTRTPLSRPLPVMEMRIATTRATNALLEHKGAPVAFLTNAGLEDLLHIGTQQRPELFALNIRKPAVLASRCIGIAGRLDAAGRELLPIAPSEVMSLGRRLVADGYSTAAVALLHSDQNGSHESSVADILQHAGLSRVILSHSISPFTGLLRRAQRTVVEAYLADLIDSYLARISSALAPGSRLMVMSSDGGLVGASDFLASEGLLSGPAGGVQGAVVVAEAIGLRRLITCDMGGTSTDVSLVNDRLEYVSEHRVGDGSISALAVAVESVAAGGGSVCWFDGHRFRVGPHSAGARPGPACYGAGGPLTITDVNLLLGRLVVDHFSVPLVQPAAQEALDELIRTAGAAGHHVESADRLLIGLRSIADELMAEAIRTISVRRGYDPSDYCLCSFGGAGAQHACAVADLLGMSSVLIPAHAAHLSALGVGVAPIRRSVARQILKPHSEFDDASIAAAFADLDAQALILLSRQQVDTAHARIESRQVELRLSGQEAALTIDLPPELTVSLQSLFEARYLARYGCSPGDRALEVVSLRVIAAGPMGRIPPAPMSAADAQARSQPMLTSSGWRAAPVCTAGALVPGRPIDGPALVNGDGYVVVVEEGWSIDRLEDDSLRMRRLDDARRCESSTRHRNNPRFFDPVDLELFTNRFASVAADMGEVLRRTALSTNVKERLDYSCGLLDPAGRLVVNAPHIPVHLGALGECVRRVREVIDMRDGDVVITNHPAFGGSHLPDVTLITPVFLAGELLGHVASRAHHAEIGGSRPGSMPPRATSLAEEGVVIPPMKLIDQGRARWDLIDSLLVNGPFPSRAPAENLADLRAAQAANTRGAALLRSLCISHGSHRTVAAMQALLELGADRTRETLRAAAPAYFECVDALDDGSPLAVRIAISVDGSASFDFSGTAATHPGNLNATPAIVRSAVMYIIRLLLRRPMPLNEGLLNPVLLILPPRSLLNPEFPADAKLCPAVVGGNTETSQRLVELMMQALGPILRTSGSQATMNNLIFGNDSFGYYETICGGSGAGDGFDGADAVHTHMTNTRLTDVEILERRYPVRVEQFAIRTGSGGAGRFRGGCGVTRRLRFLVPVSLSLLSQHRDKGPMALEGAFRGSPGRQHLTRSGGSVMSLAAIDACEALAGDVLTIETPGGGGFGPPVGP